MGQQLACIGSRRSCAALTLCGHFAANWLEIGEDTSARTRIGWVKSSTDSLVPTLLWKGISFASEVSAICGSRSIHQVGKYRSAIAESWRRRHVLAASSSSPRLQLHRSLDIYFLERFARPFFFLSRQTDRLHFSTRASPALTRCSSPSPNEESGGGGRGTRSTLCKKIEHYACRAHSHAHVVAPFEVAAFAGLNCSFSTYWLHADLATSSRAILLQLVCVCVLAR